MYTRYIETKLYNFTDIDFHLHHNLNQLCELYIYIKINVPNSSLTENKDLTL